MKLVVTILEDQDGHEVMNALSDERIGVTRVSSTGGLLNPGYSTLLIGVEEGQLPHVMKVISDLAAVRQAVASYAYHSTIPLSSLVEVQVGGFTSFVLDINQFEQI